MLPCSLANQELGHFWCTDRSGRVFLPTSNIDPLLLDNETPPFQKTDCRVLAKTGLFLHLRKLFLFLHCGSFFCFLMLGNSLSETRAQQEYSKSLKVQWEACSRPAYLPFLTDAQPCDRATAWKRGTSQVLRNDLCECTECFYPSVLWPWAIAVGTVVLSPLMPTLQQDVRRRKPLQGLCLMGS